MTVQTYQLPFDVSLPPSRTLSAGNLKCMYERGHLRYIYLGDATVLRMIYTALRDKNWETVACHITDEVIEESEESFTIKYTATYQHNQISYKAFFEVDGKNDTISFFMKGIALNRFQTNRIGICVHHPIRDCASKNAAIQRRDGTSYKSTFPTHISPYQLFKDVRQMQWPISDGVDAVLTFEGDVFETEDQRNWTDASYKTYSRPLELPFPFWVVEGETIEQKITLKVNTNKEISITPSQSVTSNEEIKIPFPKIGYCRSKGIGHLTLNEINLLKRLPFDHYRVEIKIEEAAWQEELGIAFSEAKQLMTKLEIVVFFGHKSEEELPLLIPCLQEHGDHITSILVLQKNYRVTPISLLELVYPALKNAFPSLKIGYGTDAYFAELNRNRPLNSSFDFVSYSINPQVHAFDTHSLLENLQAQGDTIKTAQAFVGTKAIHISPITLKRRGNPDAINPLLEVPNAATEADPRQHTWLAAYWTLQTIKNLGEATSLTFYETVGIKGLLKDSTHSSIEIGAAVEDTLTPIYKVLAAIKSFAPKWIVTQNHDDTVGLDMLLLQNTEGNYLKFIINENSPWAFH